MRLTTKRRPKLRPSRQRGSALLVTLLVMVGLSLLGLGFVAISETESSISINQRNYAQVHAVAEAGSRVVLEWFQDPAWADARGLLPANTNAIKTARNLTFAGIAATDFYKPSGLLCDKPFKPKRPDRFFGDEDHPDVVINATTNATFLANFNAALFNDLTDGQVTDIRLYAPPMVGATLNANGFFEGGVRYGVATIKITAARFKPGSGAVEAQRWVKLVVSEWPFPGPQGPVQSNANISTGGNFGVHWGRMTSELDMEIKRPLIGLPWFDAWSWITFENGYYADGFTSNNVAINPASGNFYDRANWLYEVIGRGFQDPWYQARAKGAITNSAAGTLPHPFKFSSVGQNVLNAPDVGYSNWFQNQDHDNGPHGDYQMVVFPKIDYEFWKNISQAATTTNSNVHYLRWTSGENFTDGVTVQRFAQWVNVVTGAKPGFYFFDTQNGINPQGGAGGTLTPDITVNSSDDGNEFIMKGFIYLNTASFGTQGIRGPGGWYNFPGEPYRDVGFRHVDTGTNNYDGTVVGNTNGQWDYQELNGNGRCDVFVASRTVTRPEGGTYTGWFPVPWTPGCTPGFNDVAGANCSEPHEPFLNLIYPTDACCGGGGDPNDVVVGWEDPSTFVGHPTKPDAAGNPIPCNASLHPPDPDCTHNGYNANGRLVQNFGNQPNTKPILDGVLYNEGAFDTQGNAAYFGSVLIEGNIRGTGTPEVWFDECLVKGCWQDKFKELPRVYVTAEETDQ